jgi:predicted ester cyclase
MSVEENKEIVRRWVTARNTNDLDLVLSVWDESRHDHVKAGFNAMTNAFSDMQITIEDIFGEGDLSALRATFHAIHSGMYQNIPPTQKQITIATNDIYTIENGKISGPLAKVD